MANQYGKNLEDYAHLAEAGSHSDVLERQQAVLHELNVMHQAYGRDPLDTPDGRIGLADWDIDYGIPQQRVGLAEFPMSALAFMRSNMESSMQESVDVWHRTPRDVEDYIYVDRTKPYGTLQVGWNIRDYMAEAKYLDEFGTLAPVAGSIQRRVNFPVKRFGTDLLDAVYTLQQVRAASQGMEGLDAGVLREAVLAGMRLLENTALFGDPTFGGNWTKGLLNQTITTSSSTFVDSNNNPVVWEYALSKNLNGTFDGQGNNYASEDDVVYDLQKLVRKFLERNDGEIVKRTTGDLVFCAPVEEHGVLTESFISTYSDQSIWDRFATNNLWYQETGRMPMLFTPFDMRLNTLATGGGPRIGMWVKDEAIAGMCITQNPLSEMPYQRDEAIVTPVRGANGPTVLRQSLGVVYVKAKPY